MSRQVVAVDFDGTITLNDTHGADSPLAFNGAMIERMKEHHANYDFIVIFTARPEADRPFVERKLKEWGVPYDALKMEKLRYDLFYEDRAVSPGDPKWPRPK